MLMVHWHGQTGFGPDRKRATRPAETQVAPQIDTIPRLQRRVDDTACPPRARHPTHPRHLAGTREHSECRRTLNTPPPQAGFQADDVLIARQLVQMARRRLQRARPPEIKPGSPWGTLGLRTVPPATSTAPSVVITLRLDRLDIALRGSIRTSRGEVRRLRDAGRGVVTLVSPYFVWQDTKCGIRAGERSHSAVAPAVEGAGFRIGTR